MGKTISENPGGGSAKSGSTRSKVRRHADIPVSKSEEDVGASIFVSNVSCFDLERIDAIVCDMCFDESDWNFAMDDLSGEKLPLDLVLAARKEEVDHMLGHTFHIVDRAECIAKTGKQPISTCWIDTDKSHGQGVMKVRSRFVARDFKKGERDREDLFCATPPLELLRVLVSLLVTRRRSIAEECAR